MPADAAECMGAVKGADGQGADSSGGNSVGGATSKVMHAARLRMSEALANGWPTDRRHGPRREVVRLAPLPRVRVHKTAKAKVDSAQKSLF